MCLVRGLGNEYRIFFLFFFFFGWMDGLDGWRWRLRLFRELCPNVLKTILWNGWGEGVWTGGKGANADA